MKTLTDFVSLATFDYSFNCTIKNSKNKNKIILEKQPANSTRSTIIFKK